MSLQTRESQARDNINSILATGYRQISQSGGDAAENLNATGPSLSNPFGLDTNATAWEIEKSLGEYVDEVTKKEKAGTASPDEISTRDDIFKGLQFIDSERENVTDPQAIAGDQPLLASGGRPTTSGTRPNLTPGSNSYASAAGVARDTKILTQAATAAEAELPEGEAPDVMAGEGVGAEITRTAYQCFLLYNLKYFSSIHKTVLKNGLTGTQYKKVKNDSIDTVGYKTKSGSPRIFLTNESDVSSTLINKLNMCAGNEDFSNIKTHEYAQLVPLLKIYKFFPGETTKMVELEFDNRTRLDGISRVLNTTHPTGQQTDSVYGKGVGSGVKSFDWRFLGTDPFTATRDIEATLRLSFQHFSSITKVRHGPNLLPKVTPGNRTSIVDPGPPVPYKYIDLIVQPDCRDLPTDATKKRLFSKAWQPECYEIRVDVGYQEPGPGHKLSEGVKDSICCQRDSLFLTPVDHSFSFNPDGTMELTINYRGRLENLMRDKIFNVLMPGGGFGKVAFNEPKASSPAGNAALRGLQAVGSMVGITDRPSGTTGRRIFIQDVEKSLITERGKINPNQEKIRELERVRAIFFANSKQFFYNGILDRLQTLKMIWTHPMTADEFWAFSDWRRPESKVLLPDPITLPPRGKLAAPDAAKEVRLEQVSTTPINDDFEPTDLLKKTLESEEVRDRLRDAIKSRIYTVDYVYLGDLIATVASNVLNENVMLGSASATNPMAAFNVGTLTSTSSRIQEIADNFKIILGNINVILPNDTTETPISLAHIPISLESFQDFMIKNVLSKDTLFYSFTEFLNDLVSELITNLFSDTCFDGLLSVDARTSTTLISSISELNPNVYTKASSEPYKTVHAELSLPLAGQTAFELCNKDTPFHKLPHEYLVVNAVNTHPKNLAGTLAPGVRGDNTGDRNRGILHFTYGMDRGLLKSVAFNKTDQEYLPEARFTSEGDFVFNQLSNVYEVTFNMLGNSIFKPGMHIYFDPSPIGAGMPWQRQENSSGDITLQSWSNVMGLGGYHLVTGIAHSIKPGSFGTTVKARWVTSGQMPSTTVEEDKAEYYGALGMPT